jgi:hypothetical protein
MLAADIAARTVLKDVAKLKYLRRDGIKVKKKCRKKTKKNKIDENRENRKPTCLKTDHRSVFGLLKTDRSRFRFPAGLYLRGWIRYHSIGSDINIFINIDIGIGISIDIGIDICIHISVSCISIGIGIYIDTDLKCPGSGQNLLVAPHLFLSGTEAFHFTKTDLPMSKVTLISPGFVGFGTVALPQISSKSPLGLMAGGNSPNSSKV